MAIAACGDRTIESGGTTTPPITTPASSAVSYPTGPDDVVVRVASVGGFVPAGTAFVEVPTLLITGDGRLFKPGVQTMEFPGPLLPAITLGSITPTGIERLLAVARTEGLLTAPVPEYAPNNQVADAPSTVVDLAANGAQFHHQADALGFVPDAQGDPDSELTPERQHLLRFVNAATDLPATVGADELGPEDVWTPEAYRLQAREADPSTIDGGAAADDRAVAGGHRHPPGRRDDLRDRHERGACGHTRGREHADVLHRGRRDVSGRARSVNSRAPPAPNLRHMGELWESGAGELAAMIRAKQVSSAEVVEAHLARIDAVNPTVNAITEVLAERALADARLADARRRRRRSARPAARRAVHHQAQPRPRRLGDDAGRAGAGRGGAADGLAGGRADEGRRGDPARPDQPAGHGRCACTPSPACSG